MTTNTISQLTDPHGFSPDPLTDLLRSGAQRLIEQAVEAELSVLLEAYASEKTDDGRARLVRHGHLPEREVMTGIGAVPVKVARVRDRGDTAEKARFTSTTLPPYLRKAKSIEELLPWLYLKGISTGDRHEALAAIPDTRPQCRRAVRDHNRTAQGRLVGRVRPQTATCCWPTMTSLPNIGSTSEPPTRSKAPLPPHWQNQRLPQPRNWLCHGVQVDDVSTD